MHDGGHRLADVEAAIGPRTRLVAASHVHFRTGFRLDLDALCALAHRHSVLVCVDAIQSLGALPLDLSATPVDFLAAGGHKWLGGPPGTGVFFCRGTRLDLLAGAPLGWFGYQDSDLIFGQGPGHLRYDLAPRPAARRFEGGMLNFVGLAGLAAALEEVVRIGPATIWTRVAELAGRLRRGLATRGYQLALPEDAPGSGIVSFRPPDPDHDPHDAATPLSVDPAAGHTDLLAAGYRCSYPDGWIRLSPHHTTSDADIESVLEFLAIDRSKY
jgi:selenocysteine lyase/cysteine desulfurase